MFSSLAPPLVSGIEGPSAQAFSSSGSGGARSSNRMPQPAETNNGMFGTAGRDPPRSELVLNRAAPRIRPAVNYNRMVFITLMIWWSVLES
jgi:hypothetical protein